MVANAMAQRDRSAGFRWRTVLATAFALSLHLAILLWLSAAAAPQQSPSMAVGGEQPMPLEVHLLSAPKRAAETPLRPFPAMKRPLGVGRPAAISQARRPQQKISVAAGAVTPTLQLFNPDGSIRMPASTASRAVPQDTNVADMRSVGMSYCHHTSYAQGYARGQDETLGAEVARKYLRWIGMYNPVTEAAYQERRTAHEQACAH